MSFAFSRRWFRSSSTNRSNGKRFWFPRFDETRSARDVDGAAVGGRPYAGGQPRVKVYDATNGGVLLNFLAFESAFTGGVRVATGDVTGDGVADIIAGKGPGGRPAKAKVRPRSLADRLRNGIGKAKHLPHDASVNHDYSLRPAETRMKPVRTRNGPRSIAKGADSPRQ